MSKVVFPWVWDGSKPVKLLGKPDGAAVVAPRPKLKSLNYDQTGTLAAGGSETATVQPDAGKIWYVWNLSFRVDAPPGASSGIHTFRVRDYTDGMWWVYMRSNYNTALRLMSMTWESADIAHYPDDRSAFTQAIRSIVASHDNPVYLAYWNGTNADQTNARRYRLWVIEVDEEP